MLSFNVAYGFHAVELGYYSRNHFFSKKSLILGLFLAIAGFFFLTHGLLKGTEHLLVSLMTGFGG